MKAVITADIINSRKVDPQIWLPYVKEVLLQNVGEEYKSWEIYRGDNIQLIIEPLKALYISILIKATIKQIADLDIRIAIGIGKVSYESEKVTSSNGEAFIYSGAVFDGLKKHTLLLKTPWDDFDESINIMFNLATLTMDHWKPTMAEIVKTQLENPNFKQIEIAEKLYKKQSNVSYSLKKAGFDEILELLSYYEKKIKKIC